MGFVRMVVFDGDKNYIKNVRQAAIAKYLKDNAPTEESGNDSAPAATDVDDANQKAFTGRLYDVISK